MCNTSFVDRYSDGASVVHRLDPRTKLLGSVLFVVAVSLTPPGRWLAFAADFTLIAALVLLSRVPVAHVLRRSALVLPFVVPVAALVPFLGQDTTAGITLMASVLLKAWLSAVSLIVLSATTGVTCLLRGLERLRVPRLIPVLLSFMYRYIFVLVDEAMRMKRARDSRSAGGSRVWHLRSVGSMTGTLFVRSYERGERVYAAMLSRGFTGEVPSLARLSFGRADILAGGCFALAVVAGAAVGWL